MAPSRRLVRRRPLWERITATLDPRDILLWLSEEIETREWSSSKLLGTQIGLGMSVIFMIARANSFGSDDDDDIFEDDGGTWMPFMAGSIVWTLLITSVWNAYFTLTRVRHYRLFEVNVDTSPETPSMRRVKVQSSPVSSSPLRFISDLIGQETAESRAHPDKTHDVWELSVWDPLPVCLRLFCLFSPGHAFIYWIFFPLDKNSNAYPSVTIAKCIMLQLVLSAQLFYMQIRFAQQAKDTAIIHKEVLHEYDTKYVHPRLHPVVRDAGTQVSSTAGPDGSTEARLYSEHGTPTTLIKREFRPHPNPNYSQHIADGQYPNVMSPRYFDRSATPQSAEVFPVSRVKASGHRHSLPAQSPPVPAHARRMAEGAGHGSTNFGGSMGVYTHSNSPLKKTASMGDMNPEFMSSPRTGREMAALEQRGSSPEKPAENRRQTTANISGFPGYSPSPFGDARNRRSNERYPSRWS